MHFLELNELAEPGAQFVTTERIDFTEGGDIFEREIHIPTGTVLTFEYFTNCEWLEHDCPECKGQIKWKENDWPQCISYASKIPLKLIYRPHPKFIPLEDKLFEIK